MKKFLKIFGVVLLSLIVIFSIFVMYMVINGKAELSNEDPTYWEDDVAELNTKYEGVSDVDIVLGGSSSARKWTTYEDDFAPYSIINTGFGGSKIGDNIYYYDELYGQYNPEVILFWAGTNDINGIEGNSKTGEETAQLAIEFYNVMRESNPDTTMVMIPINPSKMRFSVWDEATIFNDTMEQFASENDYIEYVDVTNELLIDDSYNSDLLADGLHLNAEGYQIVADATYEIVDGILVR